MSALPSAVCRRTRESANSPAFDSPSLVLSACCCLSACLACLLAFSLSQGACLLARSLARSLYAAVVSSVDLLPSPPLPLSPPLHCRPQWTSGRRHHHPLSATHSAAQQSLATCAAKLHRPSASLPCLPVPALLVAAARVKNQHLPPLAAAFRALASTQPHSLLLRVPGSDLRR